jgi:hypothetical protein
MHWLRGSIPGYSADTAGFQGEHGTVHSLPLMSKGEEKDKRKKTRGRVLPRKRVLPSMTKGEIVGTIFTGSIDLSLMASTVVKQTSESFKDSRKISSGGIAFL